jgi:hypothetical protein
MNLFVTPHREFPAMPSLSRRAFLGASLASLAVPCINTSNAPSVAAESRSPVDPDTLFLTWQRDPTTTMTIQWVGPQLAPADAAVSYAAGLPGASVWVARAATVHDYPFTDLKVHRVELDGLIPGADYQFRIGTAARTYRFRTMPARATDVIHFISGGDCGTGAHAVANNQMAARQDPMFALIGGDLAYENGQSAATHLAFLRNFSRHMIGDQGRLIPMVACIGNHEVGDGCGYHPSRAPFFYTLFDGLFQDHGHATLDFGDYLSLVLMDTGHTSPVEGEQAYWLEEELRSRVDHPHVLVVGHVPAYPSARDMASTGGPQRAHWVPLFERYRVPVVLEHHDHTFKRSKLLLNGHENSNGVLYLGDGSWGMLRAPNRPERLSHLALVRQDYHLSLHRIEGAQRFHVALAENGRVMDVYQTGQRLRGLVRAG